MISEGLIYKGDVKAETLWPVFFHRRTTCRCLRSTVMQRNSTDTKNKNFSGMKKTFFFINLDLKSEFEFLNFSIWMTDVSFTSSVSIMSLSRKVLSVWRENAALQTETRIKEQRAQNHFQHFLQLKVLKKSQTLCYFFAGAFCHCFCSQNLSRCYLLGE